MAERCTGLRFLALDGTKVQGVDSATRATKDAQQIFAALLRGVLLPVARIQFLGSGNVGKTWLFERCFLDRPVDPNRDRVRTPDIDLIRPEQCVWKPKLRTPQADQEVEPRVWDFGGQLVLHGVHETFLCDDGRTVYVLVLSANAVQGSQLVGREETGNAVAYWRRMIAHFGSGRPRAGRRPGPPPALRSGRTPAGRIDVRRGRRRRGVGATAGGRPLERTSRGCRGVRVSPPRQQGANN